MPRANHAALRTRASPHGWQQRRRMSILGSRDGPQGSRAEIMPDENHATGCRCPSTHPDGRGCPQCRACAQPSFGPIVAACVSTSASRKASTRALQFSLSPARVHSPYGSRTASDTFTRDRRCPVGRRYLWQQLKRLAVAWCDGCEVTAIEGQDYWGIESLGQSDD